MNAVEQAVLAEVTPTREEEKTMQEVAEALRNAADARLRSLRVPGAATIQGSVAKGTWLRGSGDVDLFLLLDPSVPEERLEGVAEEVARGVLEGVQKRYAQHPYLVGTFRGLTVDMVPAYRVASAGARMSAVDRTPFHTEWVRSNLGDGAAGEVRLLKRWMKGVGVYGAQTAIGGFSGYLVEVLAVRFGSFAGVLSWLAADAQPRRIALGPDQVTDEVAPLVVVDPVDPARNCAAAVQQETLATAVEAARAYQEKPERRFFFPQPPRPEQPASLRDALTRSGAAWLGLRLRPRTDRLDLVFPQFQKGTRAVAAALLQAGFPVRRMACQASEAGDDVFLQWLAEAEPLPESRLHRGPNVAARVHADRFRAKWEGHPDATGPMRVGADGRLEVDVRVPHRTAGAWLRANVESIPVGRHVADAMADARILDDPGEVPPAWAAQAAEFILGRPPWQR